MAAILYMYLVKMKTPCIIHVTLIHFELLQYMLTKQYFTFTYSIS
jgi:hypothetical protein